MSFLPEWWSQGVQGMDNNGGFGTANMFNKPMSGQTGDFGGYLPKLIAMLRNKGQDTQGGMDMTGQGGNAPQTNSLPSFTPYQTTPIGPDMGQTNMVKDFGLGPDGSKRIFPNWNKTYGGY